MLEDVYNIINVLSDKQAEVVIAVIGFLSATVVAGIGLFGSALTIMLNKRSERKVELRKIKENQYIEFLSCLAEARGANSNERANVNKLLSKRIQTIYLVGNKDVQEALSKFLLLFTSKNVSTAEQNKLYADLIEKMKKDLYGRHKKSLDQISFTIFQG